jgi:carbon-monoxide dehydrogenase large subunit
LDNSSARSAGQIGLAIPRREDARLLTGMGAYADDLRLENAVHMAVVRSPHAHAEITAIGTEEAATMPGVLAVVQGADLRDAGLRPIPHATGHSRAGSDVPLVNRDGSERRTRPQAALPCDRARFVGEAIAVVIAESAAKARDAADVVEIDWAPLPFVTRATEALRPEAPVLWPEIPGNLTVEGDIGEPDLAAAKFADARHRVRFVSQINRVTGVHMEPRAVSATWSEADGYAVHASHGIGVIKLRDDLAEALGEAPERVRVIAPRDVGGNFGTRNATPVEFVLAAFAARLVGRPVHWTADRTESFLSDFQGRDLHVDAELALDAEGRILAVRSVNTANNGAYPASFVPLNKGAQLIPSVYRIPAAHIVARAAVTNTPATIPYRSAGRPEAIYTIERLLDRAARQCGFDRLALRRLNIVRPDDQPYRSPTGITYDNGDYAKSMDAAAARIDWENFPARRAEAAALGQCRGIAISPYIETTSGAPRERAEIVVLPEGYVDVIIGTQSTGQGHETSFPQVVGELLGVPHETVRLRTGDTDFVTAGGGSHSGRSMRMGSIVMREAGIAVVERARSIAAALAGVDVSDVEFGPDGFRAAPANRPYTLWELARAALDDPRVPPELRGPLEATSDRLTPGLAFPFGAAACEVEVDPETGVVRFVRYVSVDDVGRAVNPLIVHGQTHGGIAQGVGQALMEQIWFDPESGQNLSASFQDYAIPRAADLPMFDAELQETPAEGHPLGIRPGGEGGTTPALGVVTNAIIDALSVFGVEDLEMPATPLRVWEAIQSAKGQRHD